MLNYTVQEYDFITKQLGFEVTQYNLDIEQERLVLNLSKLSEAEKIKFTAKVNQAIKNDNQLIDCYYWRNENTLIIDRHKLLTLLEDTKLANPQPALSSNPNLVFNKNTIKQEIINDLTIPKTRGFVWNIATMMLAIEYKKQHRTDEQVMNCFVLSADAKNNEWVDFLAMLNKQLHSLEMGLRFQVAVQQGVHWTTIDFQKSHKLKYFIVDSAVSNYTYTAKLERQIDKQFKKNVEGYLLVADASYVIQNSDNGCSRFTLDNLFHLQKYDIFKILAQVKVEESYGVNLVILNADFPKELAFLLRNTQSLTTLAKYQAATLNQVINKKGQTLQQSVDSYTKLEPTQNSEHSLMSKQNKAIDYFRDKMQIRILEFVKNKTELQLIEMMKRRTGFDYLKATRAQREQLDKTQITERAKRRY